MAALKDARDAIRACRETFAAVAVFSCIVNLLMLTTSIYSLQLFDRVLSSRSMDTLTWLTVIAVVALGFYAFLETMRSHVLVHVGTWLDQKLSPLLYTYTIQSGPFTRQTNVQSLRDLGTIKGFLSGQGVFSLFDAPWIPIYLLVLFMIHPWLGWVATGVAIVFFFLTIFTEYATRKLLTEAGMHSIHNYMRAEASARNAEVIEAMGMMPAVVDQWQQNNDKVLALQAEASRRAGLINGITRFLRMLAQIAMMGVGVYLALHNQITPGAMMASSIIMGRALAPVEQLIGVWKMLVAARAAYDRINKKLAQPVAERSDMTLPTPQGRVSVENVFFGPPGSPLMTLNGIAFDLDPGELLCVIGPSAAGKSSLARLLVGVWPPRSGKVRLDGMDVFAWKREDFGSFTGYLPQDIELFAGTVKQNIARMTEGDDMKVVQAAMIAGVHDMILRLPRGYDTEIGEGGSSLSGGQRQRIALARAFYGAPKLLVLDEPNANLDSEGENALAGALRNAKEQGITTIVISHRPNLLGLADKLLYLQEGRVGAFGPRDEVLAKLGFIQPQSGAAPTPAAPVGPQTPRILPMMQGVKPQGA